MNEIFECPTDLLADCLQVMAYENNQAMKQASAKYGFFLGGMAAKFVFHLALHLDLPEPAKYLAAELFERFMVAHIRDLYGHVKESRARQREEWSTIVDRVRNQLSLRALSCCQIASKLTSHYKIINTATLCKVLRNLGYHYSSDSVLQSEIRVLKTVDYQVISHSPLNFVEILLEIMGRNNRELEVKTLHRPCLQLLDVVYLRLTSIYACLYHVATGRLPTSIKDRKRIAYVMRDYMLQATAIISASSYIVDQDHTDKVVDSLSKITKIPSNDILDFAAILIQHVVEDD